MTATSTRRVSRLDKLHLFNRSALFGIPWGFQVAFYKPATRLPCRRDKEIRLRSHVMQQGRNENVKKLCLNRKKI